MPLRRRRGVCLAAHREDLALEQTRYAVFEKGTISANVVLIELSVIPFWKELLRVQVV